LDGKMQIGDTGNVGRYQVQLKSLEQVPGPNFRAMRADIEVSKTGEAPFAVMHPEKRAFTASQSVTSETAIDRSIWRDLYLSLGEQVGNGAWTVRVYHKPLVNWIWGGALLMAFGGAFAVADRRYWPEMRKQREARAVDTS